MSQNETPENRLEQASQVVAQWRDRIQTITQNIADTEQKAAESKLNRQNYVLGATLGDVQHKKELDRLRQAHDTAQLTLSDLNAALPLAHAELKAAIAEHKSAENAVKAVTVKRLARERVTAAAKIDAALAIVAEAYTEYEHLGTEMMKHSVFGHGGLISAVEGTVGLVRFAAALPAKPFLDLKKAHPMADLSTGRSLAKSEAEFWGVSSEIL